MFGIKIISKKKYEEWLEHHRLTASFACERLEEVKNLKSDIESPRQQNSDIRKENNKLRDQNNNYLREVKSLREFKRDTLEAMGQIDLAGFRLSYCTKKCKHCENEQQDCRKYQFGNHQYCVIPK